MMDRDEDLIRGIGYMVIQASHLEREIEEICRWFSMGMDRPKYHESARVSDKIKWCKSQINLLGDTRLEGLARNLDKARNLLEKRNGFVHGQIYFAVNAPEKLIPSKKSEKERLVKPADAYDLAEKMYELHLRILSENAFILVDSFKGRINA